MARPEEMFQCLTPICDYIYRPDQGDRLGNIPPGTQFETLPADWHCPFCWAGKMRFRRLREPRPSPPQGPEAALDLLIPRMA